MKNESLQTSPADNIGAETSIDALPRTWAIGMFAGESPFRFHSPAGIQNPVLTAKDVSDAQASFVADPFMIRSRDTWHLFFEVKNIETRNGEIGLATSSDDATWSYRQIVLREPFHLSYPYVFEWDGAYYMIPETLSPYSVRLYKADPFPARWSFVKSLVEGRCADPSVFRFDEKWWMFACATPYRHDTLRLYFADDLLGRWTEHPQSPVIEGNARMSRPAGRVLAWNDRLIRYAQDCYPHYGAQVRAFEIDELTPETYREHEHPDSPVLRASGQGWNGKGMHHIDPHPDSDGRWIACVDGHYLP